MHEGSHWRLLKHRPLNDIASNLFLAFPLGLATGVYRRFHFAHHRLTLTDEDPELALLYRPDRTMRWPKSRRGLLVWFVKDLTGLHVLVMLRWLGQLSIYQKLFRASARGGPDRGERIWFIGFTLVVVVGLTLFDAWDLFVLLWLIPQVTVFWATTRMRVLSEHMCAPNTHELNATRSTVPTLLDRLFIAHVHFTYHLEHHLFPSVPHYNLPELHRRLMEDPEFRNRALIAHGYFSLSHGVLGAVTYP